MTKAIKTGRILFALLISLSASAPSRTISIRSRTG